MTVNRLRSAVAVLAICCCAFQPASAQSWIGDSLASRMNWPALDVMVIPDTVQGLEIWAESRDEKLTYFETFDPKLVDDWFGIANAIVAPNPPPGDPRIKFLDTGRLEGVGGSGLRIVRRKKHGVWLESFEVVFERHDTRKSFYFSANRAEAEALLKAVLLQEGRARLSATDTLVVDWSRVDEVPRILSVDSLPGLPEGHGTKGDRAMVVGFIVRADGTADPATFHALRFEEPFYVQRLVEGLRRARFSPAMVKGKPVTTNTAVTLYY